MVHFSPPPAQKKKWLVTLGLSITTAITIAMWINPSLIASLTRPLRGEDSKLILGACSGYDSGGLFSRYDEEGIAVFLGKEDDATTVDVWSEKYHGDVDEALMQYLSEGSLEEQTPADCMNLDKDQYIPPPQKIIEIASRLPPWEKSTAKLSRNDTGVVLLEYLRAYECALTERFLYLSAEIREEEERRSDYKEEQGEDGKMPDIGGMTRLLIKQMRQVMREIAVSRPALNRALTYIGGMAILGTLDKDVECIQRASIDIRNAIGLAAEASACMPRIWDSKDALRDMFDPPVN